MIANSLGKNELSVTEVNMSVVGKSSRTPFKHWLLNSHLGRIAGVLNLRSPQVPAKANPFLCVDLCAGDGLETESHNASPVIISRHLNWFASQRPDNKCEAVFIEKASATHRELRRNLSEHNLLFPHNVIIGDAREYRVQPTSPWQAIFVNCDPNHVADMPLAEPLAASLTETTTFVR